LACHGASGSVRIRRGFEVAYQSVRSIQGLTRGEIVLRQLVVVDDAAVPCVDEVIEDFRLRRFGNAHEAGEVGMPEAAEPFCHVAGR
jgi:hypothetical protein